MTPYVGSDDGVCISQVMVLTLRSWTTPFYETTVLSNGARDHLFLTEDRNLRLKSIVDDFGNLVRVS